MATLAEFRQNYPQYDDMSDAALADALHRKFYSDIPRDEFNVKIGLAPTSPKQEQPDPGVWGTVKDAFTGSARTEFPDAPEFLPAYVSASGGKLGPELNAISGSAVTPDPMAQLDILKRNIPGLESKKDVHGNIMLKAPNMSDWAYLNKPGLSARDVDEFGTQTLATLPFAGLFGIGGSVPARIATGAVAGGGSSVALDAAAAAQGSEQGVDPLRAAISTGFGAAAGPVLGKAPQMDTPRQKALEAADRIAVDVPRAVASDNVGVQAAAGGLQRLPIVGGPMQAAVRRTTEQLGEAATGAAEGFGGGITQSAFGGGDTAKRGIVGWIKRGAKDIISRGYDDLDQLIKPDTLVPLSKTARAVRELTDADVMSASQDGAKVIGLVREAVSRKGGLTYSGLKELRTRIGERVFGDIAPEQGTSARALDKIYSALSEDLKFGVSLAGKGKGGKARALAAFERANDKARETFAVRDSLKSIVGAEGDAAPERVFDRILQMAGTKGNADLQKLLKAREVVGSDWDEVASAVAARLGRDAQGNFSPERFVTDYGKRLSENGKNALFGGRADLKQALDDIYEVSTKFQNSLARFTNYSNAGTAVVTIGGISGALTSPLHTLATALGGRTTSFILSRPVTAKAAAHWSRAYLAAATSRNRAATQILDQAGVRLMNALRNEQGETK